jgi:hypothetical protein
MPAWLIPIAGKVGLGAFILLAGLLAVWWFRRSIEKRKDAEAAAGDAKRRGEAARASQEGYIAERERQAKIDPVTGKPLPPPGGVQ